MANRSIELFKMIFHEAHVVDVDFSKWDDFIRLVAVARVMPRGEDGRFPSYQVDFCDVESFAWRSNHLGVKLDAPDQHCQLTIMDYSVKKTKAGYRFELRGMRPSPTIEIGCGRLDVRPISNSAIDVVNPKWNQPYCPLARPSIEDLFTDRKTELNPG